jgi:integrase/recombinase XerD
MTRFEQFISERQYLNNVTPATVEWYRQSLGWLGIDQPTGEDLKQFVLRMRAKGLKATSCNCRIRAVNAYLKWSGSSLKVARLKEPDHVPPTFTPDGIARFVAWKPKTWTERRLHTLVLVLADCGARIDEVLSLTWADVDFDDLLLTLHGKGRKDRRVPFSFELRKHLFRWKQNAGAGLVFPS